MISPCQRHDFIIRKAWTLSRLELLNRVSLIHRYGKVSFATIVATSFMRSITSFAVRQHRFPTANENDICAFGAKWCSSLRSEIRPYGSWSPFPQGKAYGYRSSSGTRARGIGPRERCAFGTHFLFSTFNFQFLSLPYILYIFI